MVKIKESKKKDENVTASGIRGAFVLRYNQRLPWGELHKQRTS